MQSGFSYISVHTTLSWQFRSVEILVGNPFDHFEKNFIKSGCSAVGSARSLGLRCRVFESCHSDHRPHYKAIYRLSNAVLLFMNVTINYVPSSTVFGRREVMKDALLWGDLLSTVLVRRFFSGVFFVYCSSIFDKRFMRCSSVSSPIPVPRETRSTDFER